MTTHTSKSKPEIESNMAAVSFPKLEVVLSQLRTEIFYRNLAWKSISCFLDRCH